MERENLRMAINIQGLFKITKCMLQKKVKKNKNPHLLMLKMI